MMFDLTFYDPVTYEFTVDKSVENGKREFGGYASVVLWLRKLRGAQRELANKTLQRTFVLG